MVVIPGVFSPGYFDGNIPILKEEILTVILIPLWLCPRGCTWDPGGPPTTSTNSTLTEELISLENLSPIKL